MNGGIRVGDLVAVVRPNAHGCMDGMGTIFTVRELAFARAIQCNDCNAYSRVQFVADTGRNEDGYPLVFEVWRLQKINPPAKQQTATRELVAARP